MRLIKIDFDDFFPLCNSSLNKRTIHKKIKPRNEFPAFNRLERYKIINKI